MEEDPIEEWNPPITPTKTVTIRPVPSIENEQPRNPGGFRGASREARGKALDYCRGRTNTVSVYSKLHTGWLGC
jgi:hypothetical protein